MYKLTVNNNMWYRFDISNDKIKIELLPEKLDNNVYTDIYTPDTYYIYLSKRYNTLRVEIEVSLKFLDYLSLIRVIHLGFTIQRIDDITNNILWTLWVAPTNVDVLNFEKTPENTNMDFNVRLKITGLMGGWM
ncbi:MAG: hypothetical protein ACPL1F_00975 [bacterium]